jgi:glycosyltransferase involved in cell wall biosynthesis
MANELQVSVIIPARNEAAAIGDVVRAAAAALEASGRFCPFEILVVNDGSADRTGEIAAAAGARVVSNPATRGYGGAVKRGVRAASAEVLCLVDGDGTYPVAEIPAMLAELAAGADQVIGARTAEGARVPWSRRPAKWLVTKGAGLLAGHPIPDLNSGLRCLRRARMEPLMRILPDGFSLTSTLTVAALLDGWELRWHPIGYDRRVGSSKFKAIRDTARLLLAVVRAVVYFDPLKFFLPVALGLGFCSLAFGAWDFFWEQNLTDKTVLFSLSTVEAMVLGLLADLIVKRSASR